MSAGTLQSCCYSGFKHGGSAEGETQDVNGVETYFAYPKDRSTEKAIVLLSDIIGHRFINNQLLSDEFAKNGYLVAMPDLFDGDAVSLNHAGDFDFMNWLSKDPAERVDQIVEGTIRHLRGKMSVDRVGGLGYCFGAKYVARFLKPGTIDVGYAAHPSLVTDEEWRSVRGPLSVAAAEVDQVFPSPKRHECETILEKLSPKQPYQMFLYSGTDHGFAVRGDISKDEIKFAKEQAFVQALSWMQHYL